MNEFMVRLLWIFVAACAWSVVHEYVKRYVSSNNDAEVLGEVLNETFAAHNERQAAMWAERDAEAAKRGEARDRQYFEMLEKMHTRLRGLEEKVLTKVN